ncbi:hypothetical protein BOX15_Mlig008230g2, partial [Macrostomum lignano]
LLAKLVHLGRLRTVRVDASFSTSFTKLGACLPEDLRIELSKAIESSKYQPESAQLVQRLWQHLDKRAEPPSADSRPFVLMLPPPNVTGVLHMGHALAFVIQDVLIRWHRANGRQAVWLPGFDHAGIATQVLMEKKLIKELGLNRHQIGREKFLDETAKWADQKRSEIRQQMRVLGLSVDWSEEFFTYNEKHSRVVTEAFVRLFNQGLIYRSQQLVNWSCALESAISDIEVETREISGPTRLPVPGHSRPVEFGRLHRFLYPFADAKGDDDGVVVATTRPETMLGDTAVAVHPDDARYASLIGRRQLRHPLSPTGRLLPIVGHASVDPNFGSGAVKLTPGHSRADFDIVAETPALSETPPLTVFTEAGVVGADCGAPAELVGLPRFEARDRILQRLIELGLYRGAEKHSMTLPICSRSGDIVEQQLKSQWFVRCRGSSDNSSSNSSGGPASLAGEAVRSGQLSIQPEGYAADWLEWMRRTGDWCISRQIWWGHRVPAYEVLDSNGSSLGWLAARSESEAAQAARQKFQSTSSSSFTLRRDSDVLDTWFSSGLLPLSLADWPDLDPPNPSRFPLSLLETGHDILFFWAARMVMLTQQLTGGQLPFRRVLLNGLVCDSRRRKMSKSRGNVIDPIGLVGQGGPDALRLALCSHRFQLDRVAFDPQLVDTCSRLINKLWQSHRYLRPRLSEAGLLGRADPDQLLDEIEAAAGQLDKVDSWLMSRLAGLVEVCDSSCSANSLQLQEAANRLREFWLADFCDVAVECLKSPLAGQASLRVACVASLTFLTRLAPFCPHICQLLWLAAHCDVSEPALLLATSESATKRLLAWKNRGCEEVTGFVMDLLARFRDWRTLLRPKDSSECILLYNSAQCPIDATLYSRLISQLGRTRCQAAAFDEGAQPRDHLLRLELCPGLYFAAPRASLQIDEAASQLRARLAKQRQRRDDLLASSTGGTEAQRTKVASLTEQIDHLEMRLQQVLENPS